MTRAARWAGVKERYDEEGLRGGRSGSFAPGTRSHQRMRSRTSADRFRLPTSAPSASQMPASMRMGR